MTAPINTATATMMMNNDKDNNNNDKKIVPSISTFVDVYGVHNIRNEHLVTISKNQAKLDPVFEKMAGDIIFQEYSLDMDTYRKMKWLHGVIDGGFYQTNVQKKPIWATLVSMVENNMSSPYMWEVAKAYLNADRKALAHSAVDRMLKDYNFTHLMEEYDQDTYGFNPLKHDAASFETRLAAPGITCKEVADRLNLWTQGLLGHIQEQFAGEPTFVFSGGFYRAVHDILTTLESLIKRDTDLDLWFPSVSQTHHNFGLLSKTTEIILRWCHNKKLFYEVEELGNDVTEIKIQGFPFRIQLLQSASVLPMSVTKSFDFDDGQMLMYGSHMMVSKKTVTSLQTKVTFATTDHVKYHRLEKKAKLGYKIVLPKTGVVWCANTGNRTTEHSQETKDAFAALPLGVEIEPEVILAACKTIKWVPAPRGLTYNWDLMDTRKHLSDMTQGKRLVGHAKNASTIRDYVKTPAIDLVHGVDLNKLFKIKPIENKGKSAFFLEQPVVFGCMPIKTVFLASPFQEDTFTTHVFLDPESLEGQLMAQMENHAFGVLKSRHTDLVHVSRIKDKDHVLKVLLKDCDLVDINGNKFVPKFSRTSSKQYSISWTMRVACVSRAFKGKAKVNYTVCMHPIIGVVLDVEGEPLTQENLVRTLDNWESLGEDVDPHVVQEAKSGKRPLPEDEKEVDARNNNSSSKKARFEGASSK